MTYGSILVLALSLSSQVSVKPVVKYDKFEDRTVITMDLGPYGVRIDNLLSISRSFVGGGSVPHSESPDGAGSYRTAPQGPLFRAQSRKSVGPYRARIDNLLSMFVPLALRGCDQERSIPARRAREGIRSDLPRRGHFSGRSPGKA